MPRLTVRATATSQIYTRGRSGPRHTLPNAWQSSLCAPKSMLVMSCRCNGQALACFQSGGSLALRASGTHVSTRSPVNMHCKQSLGSNSHRHRVECRLRALPPRAQPSSTLCAPLLSPSSATVHPAHCPRCGACPHTCGIKIASTNLGRIVVARLDILCLLMPTFSVVVADACDVQAAEIWDGAADVGQLMLVS